MKRLFFCFVFLSFFLFSSCCAPQQAEEDVPETVTEAPSVEPTLSYACYIQSKVNSLCVRSKADTLSTCLGYLDKNDMVSMEGQEGEWYRTFYRNQVAYVSTNTNYTRLISMEKADEKTEQTIACGCKLLGTPYVYGATRLHDGKGNLIADFSVDAFDCSSLMQYIFYYGENICLDVTSRLQSQQGEEVSFDNIERGDLLFMTNSSRKNLQGIQKIGHVGLYLGNNYILHTASDHAVIEEISDTRWKNVLTVKRIKN